jgi:lipoprotein-anchoring transpeptidase ErfK/SrfK
VKKILVGMSAVAAIVLLAACSGSPSGGGDLSLAAVSSATTTAPPPQVSTTSSQPSTSQHSSSQAPSPSSVTPKPAPSKTPAKPVVAAQPDPGVPCAATAKACVDISAHKAWLLDGGKVIYGPVPMLPGRKGYPTPTGTFHVLSKEKMHLSKEFDNAPMPNSVFFYPGDAFHTGSLSVYSHGCIHLSSAASLRFFNTLKIGDVVQVVP